MEYYAINGTLYLSHHGIIGQKWGVRRFQNKDGSLTKLGRVRYGSSDGGLSITKTTDKNGKASYSVKRSVRKMTPEEIAERARQEKALRDYKADKKAYKLQQRNQKEAFKKEKQAAEQTAKYEEKAYKDQQRKQREAFRKAKQAAKYEKKMNELTYQKELEKQKTQQKIAEAEIKNKQVTANLAVQKEAQSQFLGAAKKMVGDAVLESGKEILKATMVSAGKYAVGSFLTKKTGEDYYFNTITKYSPPQNKDKAASGDAT